MSTQRTERIPNLTLGWRLKMALGDGSAQEMADYLGVTRQTLSRWMGDKGSPPKRAYLAQWALRTDVDFEWLCTGRESAERSPHPDGGLVGEAAGADTPPYPLREISCGIAA